MKYIFIIGIIFKKYKKPAKIKITTSQTLIDEFDLDQDLNPVLNLSSKMTHNKDKIYSKHNKVRIDRQIVDREWPIYFRVYELEKLAVDDVIKIEVDNANSDYTNGFMRKSSTMQFPVIALFPKKLCTPDADMLLEFMLRAEDGWDKHITRKSNNRLSRRKKEGESARVQHRWPSRVRFHIERNGNDQKNHIVSKKESIGGCFSISFQIKRKHGIDYLYQDIGESDIGFWNCRDLDSLLLTSCGQLLNIYNEDQRSNHTKD